MSSIAMANIAHMTLIISSQKGEKKVWSVRFSAKAIVIYFSKKTDLNSKNNDGVDKSAHF